MLASFITDFKNCVYLYLLYSILFCLICFTSTPSLELVPLYVYSHQWFDVLCFRSFKSFKTTEIESLVKARLGDVRSQRISEDHHFLVSAPEDSFWELKGEEAAQEAAKSIANSTSDDPNKLMKGYLSNSTDDQDLLYPTNLAHPTDHLTPKSMNYY